MYTARTIRENLRETDREKERERETKTKRRKRNDQRQAVRCNRTHIVSHGLAPLNMTIMIIIIIWTFFSATLHSVYFVLSAFPALFHRF